MKKLLLIFIFSICLTRISYTQNIDSIVNHAATTYLAGRPWVGLSVGVIRKDKFHLYYFGSTQKDKNSLPVTTSLYEIGSITKTFTSMLLAQAVVDEKVNLKDDIRKYLKGSYPNLEFNGKPVQLIHLANLTSGLPDNLPENMPPFQTKERESQLFELKKIHDGYTRSQFLQDLHTVKLSREPGLNPAHSNTAAQLLGFLLENIYGMSYADLLQKYVTGPLNMKHTFISVPTSEKGFCVKGYNEKGILMPEIPKDAGSAGVLKSSLADMMKYVNYHLKEKDKRVVLSHTLFWGNYENFGIGLNWYLKTNFDEKRRIWTSGGTFGFSSYSVLYPEADFAVVTLANQNGESAEYALSEIANTIYNEVHFSALERSAEGFGFSRSVNLLLEILNQRGFQFAEEIANELKAKDNRFRLSEDELNVFGYTLLGKGNKDKALVIFKLNVSLFPESSNTYDSLAEVYESLGDKALSIKNYKRSLELNPSNTNAVEHLKKLED